MKCIIKITLKIHNVWPTSGGDLWGRSGRDLDQMDEKNGRRFSPPPIQLFAMYPTSERFNKTLVYPAFFSTFVFRQDITIVGFNAPILKKFIDLHAMRFNDGKHQLYRLVVSNRFRGFQIPIRRYDLTQIIIIHMGNDSFQCVRYFDVLRVVYVQCLECHFTYPITVTVNTVMPRSYQTPHQMSNENILKRWNVDLPEIWNRRAKRTGEEIPRPH